MIGASKILTVSYGTFSCTLEGFDDPFNTMRAIAEYFRDLAAEDRYFGAEPPTPDAAMLHRIAEREVQRRVDAKVQENGIHLRASEDATVAQVAVPAAPAVSPAVAPAATPAVTPAVAPQAAPAAAVTTADPQAETIAERLLRLRSEVAAQQQTAPAPVPQAITAATVSLTLPDYVEDTADEPDLTATAAMADFLPEDTADPAADTLPEDVASDPAPQNADPATAAPPLAADLTPGAAVAPAAQAEIRPESADLPATADLPENVDLPETLVAALAGPVQEPAPAAPAFVDLWDEDAELTASLARVMTDAPAKADTAQPDDARSVSPAAAYDHHDILAADADEPSAAQETAGDDLALDLDDSLAADIDDASSRDADGIDSIFGESQDLPPAQPLPELRPGAAEKLQRARARIYKISRADAPAASGDNASGQARTTLDDTAERDLERELAGLRDDSAAESRGAPHPFGDPSAEDAVTRLMAQADSEMEGEETKRRQSAIAHLKAAVAQTVADRRAGDVKANPEPSRIARYRNDLAMVVRSALPGAAQAKPSGDRPAPLVLVSEQRIDRPPRPAGGPIPAAPAALAQPAQIRPRRVSGSGSGLAMQAQPFPDDESDFDDLDLQLEEALADIDDDAAAEADAAADAAAGAAAPAALNDAAFRDYAERHGATSMRDMIEAAAAFLICDQNRPHFTRPQMMRHVAMVIPQTDTLREDSLRIFGALLRDGHIAKVRRGQFTLTEASPYYTQTKRTPG